MPLPTLHLSFSLRTFLIAVALVACALYWRIRPASTASQFQRALATQQFAEAAQLLDNSDPLDLTGWTKDALAIEVAVDFEKPTVSDLLLGRRRGSYQADVQFPKSELQQIGTLIATATSVRATRIRAISISTGSDDPDDLDWFSTPASYHRRHHSDKTATIQSQRAGASSPLSITTATACLMLAPFSQLSQAISRVRRTKHSPLIPTTRNATIQILPNTSTSAFPALDSRPSALDPHSCASSALIPASTPPATACSIS